MIKLTPLYSGSKGNCTLIQSEKATLLVDLGLTYQHAKNNLQALKTEPTGVDAIVITHDHTDHISALGCWCEKHKTPVFAHVNLAEALLAKYPLANVIAFDASFAVKDVVVSSCDCHHDATYCCAYKFDDGNDVVATCTDTGFVDDGLIEFLSPCRTVLIESNHDVDMLLNGSYPYQLKRRILSDLGHLSNKQCADVVSTLIDKGNLCNVVLAHLSEHNNTHELAFCECLKVIENKQLTEGKQIKLFVADQNERGTTVD